jgi:hypothetical protein
MQTRIVQEQNRVLYDRIGEYITLDLEDESNTDDNKWEAKTKNFWDKFQTFPESLNFCDCSTNVYFGAKFRDLLYASTIKSVNLIHDVLYFTSQTSMTNDEMLMLYFLCSMDADANIPSADPNSKKRKREEIERDCLQQIPAGMALWKTLLNFDIPLPIGFLLFRMYLRVRLGSVVFLKRGPETGLLLIQDLGVMFNRDTATFTLRVNIRMTSKAVVLNARNLEEAPGVFIKKYEGGGNVQFFTDCTEDYKSCINSGDFPSKSIYCVAVPYDHKNKFIFTDITGNLDREICFGSSSGGHYATAAYYKKYWGWESNKNAFSANRIEDITDWFRVSVAAQASFYKYNPSTEQCDIVVPGVGPLGPDPNPFNQKVVLGGEHQGFTGVGFAKE